MAEGVRSNRTNKAGARNRAFRRIFEQEGSVSAVTGAPGEIGRGRINQIHSGAIENLLAARFGVSPDDVPMEKFDEFVDVTHRRPSYFDEGMGFTTPRHRFISRRDMHNLLRAEDPDYIYGETHTGALQESRAERGIRGNRAVSTIRRGIDPEKNEQLLKKRERARRFLSNINAEVQALRGADIRSGQFRIPFDLIDRIREAGGAETEEGKALIRNRLKDLSNRRQILKDVPQMESKPGKYSALAQRARKMANDVTDKALGVSKKVTKSIAPVAWMSEPFSTAEAVKDILSGDPDRQMAALEFLQGLPERSTGRGLTEKEKEELKVWYDPVRGEGGI